MGKKHKTMDQLSQRPVVQRPGETLEQAIDRTFIRIKSSLRARKNATRNAARRREWVAKHPEWKDYEKTYRAKHKERYQQQHRNHSLMRLYGLTADQYNEILAKQGGTCAICLRPPVSRRLHVDHCHKTLVVRGLLCYRCNYGLGYFSTPEQLVRAGEYLTSDTGYRAPVKKRKRKKRHAG